MSQTINEGLASTISVDETGIHKTSVRSFDREDAEAYVSDAEAYSRALTDAGYLTPEVHGYDLLPDAQNGYKVVQHSEFIEGNDLEDPDLEHERKLAAIQDVIATISFAPADRRSHILSVALDAKPENFVLGNDGRTRFVDSLPPLADIRTGEFPYHRVTETDPTLSRAWIDNYVRSKHGVLARFSARGLRSLSGSSAAVRAGFTGYGLDELFSLAGSSAELHLSGTRRKILPLLASTAMRRFR